MRFIQTPLLGAYVIEPAPFRDDRGFFARIFCQEEFKTIGFNRKIIQINHSRTMSKGTIRGLHFQAPPTSEVKIIKCIQGEVFDVMVDLRTNSATFMKWHGVKLSKDNMRMIYIPEGFAHGFQTLTDNAELIYLHSALYSPEHECGLRYNDSSLAIAWPLPADLVSDKDKNYPLINSNFKGLQI